MAEMITGHQAFELDASNALEVPAAAGGISRPIGWLGWRSQVLGLRVAIALTMVVVAYSYSLATLVRGISLDTPLAYLGLVPIVSGVLIAVRGLKPVSWPDIHDRYLDYIIGMPLLAAALVAVVIGPMRLSSFFWLWRLDLLSLPVFVAGTIAVVFGVRALWRLRLPVAFLLLAWPPPYRFVVSHGLHSLTTGTIAAVRAVLHVVSVAQPVSSSDSSLFSISHLGQSFVVSVSSACSGINGMVSFLLLGIAFLSLVHGPALNRLAWLCTGLTLVWGLDLARILLIFTAGRTWGEAFAIDALHPMIGLVTFNAGILVMLATLRRFGLQLEVPSVFRRVRHVVYQAAPYAPKRRLAVRHARIAIGIVAIVAVVMAAANLRLAQFQLLGQDLGPTRLQATSVVATSIPGWLVSQTDSYPWITRYFGKQASWHRYAYARPQGGDPSPFRSSLPLTLDVISTSELGTLSAYGLEACYRFHSDKILESKRVDLGAGVIGRAIVTNSGARGALWIAVYWEWPVNTVQGEQYERVVLNLSPSEETILEAPPLSANPLAGLQLAVADAIGGSHGAADGKSARARDFLVGFARAIVAATAAHVKVDSPSEPT